LNPDRAESREAVKNTDDPIQDGSRGAAKKQYLE
jgi:hypothetical protein